MKRINEKGITLIALIITIILMLILAGVVISLTLGENGLFSTAKYAVVKTEEETAKEKLELALADLQTQKYANIDYDENIDIDSYLTSKEMIVIGDIVTVDGWNFKIDRSIPKVEESLGQGEIKTVLITTPYIGTTSFTTKVSYVYNESEIESYIYKIDDEEITKNDKEHTTPEEQELQPESTHTVKVIARYKDGTTIESNNLTIKTEPRTYLYNNGDKCVDITGGWKLEIRSHNQLYTDSNIEHFDGIGTYSSGYYEDNTNNVFMEVSHQGASKYGETSILMTSEKTIDLTKYKKIQVDAEFTNSLNAYWYVFGINEQGEEITYKFVDNQVEETELINIDSTNKKQSVKIVLASSATKGTTGKLTIKSIWLEK